MNLWRPIVRYLWFGIYLTFSICLIGSHWTNKRISNQIWPTMAATTGTTKVSVKWFSVLFATRCASKLSAILARGDWLQTSVDICVGPKIGCHQRSKVKASEPICLLCGLLSTRPTAPISCGLWFESHCRPAILSISGFAGIRIFGYLCSRMYALVISALMLNYSQYCHLRFIQIESHANRYSRCII